MSSLNENSQELIDLVTEHKDQDDNDILGELVGAGVPFGKAKGVLDKIMTSQGFRLSKADMDTKAEEILASFTASTETTPEEVSEQIDNLVEELNCTINKARNYVKAVFTGADIAYPKPARKASGPREARAPGFRGDVLTAANFAIANPEAIENDQDAFKDYMNDNGGSTTKNGTDKSARWYGAVVDLRIFAKAWKDAGNCA